MTDFERCPGCGSVVNGRSCYPVGVDTSKIGYRYLAETWGYCVNESRHIGTDETPWLEARDEAVRAERSVPLAWRRRAGKKQALQWMIAQAVSSGEHVHEVGPDATVCHNDPPCGAGE